MNNHPSLNQISFLSEQIQNDEALNKHFDLTDCWEKLSNLTLNQVGYMHDLILNKKRSKLNAMMSQIGFQPKQ